MSSHPFHFHGFVPAATPEMISQHNPQLQPDSASNAPTEGGNSQLVVPTDEADAPMQAIRKLLRK